MKTTLRPNSVRVNVHARQIDGDGHSQGWHEDREEFIEGQIDEILATHELSGLIGDYCDTLTTSPSGRKVNRWSEYEQALKWAMQDSPRFKEFMQKASRMRAEEEADLLAREDY